MDSKERSAELLTHRADLVVTLSCKNRLSVVGIMWEIPTGDAKGDKFWMIQYRFVLISKVQNSLRALFLTAFA